MPGLKVHINVSGDRFRREYLDSVASVILRREGAAATSASFTTAIGSIRLGDATARAEFSAGRRGHTAIGSIPSRRT